VERINLVEGISKYLADREARPYLHNKYIQAHVGYAFYIEACCKVRDALDLISSFEDGTSLHQIHPYVLPELWKRVTLVNVPIESNSKEFIECQLLMNLIGGATSAAKSSSNPIFDQFNFLVALMKAGFGIRNSLLKSMEMHYRGDFNKILKQINLIDYGIFKTINEGMCPAIATNTIIYIPFNSELDDSTDIFQPNDKSIPVRVLHYGKMLKRSDDSDKPDIKDIVVHIHGGGYVAMSSNGTQIYTRQWANIAQVPVFSIDYRLAPAHPFP
jgi:hypothetical protein